MVTPVINLIIVWFTADCIDFIIVRYCSLMVSL